MYEFKKIDFLQVNNYNIVLIFFTIFLYLSLTFKIADCWGQGITYSQNDYSFYLEKEYLEEYQEIWECLNLGLKHNKYQLLYIEKKEKFQKKWEKIKKQQIIMIKLFQQWYTLVFMRKKYLIQLNNKNGKKQYNFATVINKSQVTIFFSQDINLSFIRNK
ncbi:unnamed protein product [Paramecium primaurelia]|uniref:Transmembrane protein n=1 Tax=Paramecium primaurelia TaxID=5886 RepID=A0A8S1KN35_PARPR|nr:unnamed protein product [Paramecium primaurelia]